jgi:transcriptional regulator with GAF, ATPase, and Fis domain
LRHLAREHRDLEVEKLRKKYGTKFEAIQKRIKTAQAGVAREESQASRAYLDSAISFGSTILGALFGRKTASRTNVSKASTSLRSAGRAAQQIGDVARAEEKVEDLKEELEKLEQELAQEIKSLELQFDEDNLKLEPLEVTPRKSDIEAGNIALVWTPWRIDATGIAKPLYVMPT